MSLHLSDNHKNGHERKMDSFRTIRYFTRNNHIPYNPKQIPAVEPKLFVGILWALGLLSSGMYLYIDTNTWKANVLFLIAGGFWLVKLIRACIKLYQDTKLTNIEIEEKQRKLDDDIFPHQ